MFNSTDSDPVGNIRSGRTQDVNLFASFNDPIFAYSGGNDGVNAALAGDRLDAARPRATGCSGSTDAVGAPYNLYGNTTDFFAQAGDAGEAVPSSSTARRPAAPR